MGSYLPGRPLQHGLTSVSVIIITIIIVIVIIIIAIIIIIQQALESLSLSLSSSSCSSYLPSSLCYSINVSDNIPLSHIAHLTMIMCPQCSLTSIWMYIRVFTQYPKYQEITFLTIYLSSRRNPGRSQTCFPLPSGNVH